MEALAKGCPALHECPELMQDMAVSLTSHVAVETTAFLATMMAAAASAIGPNIRVSGQSVQFNIVVTHHAPRRLAWFDIAFAPVAHHGLELQAELSRKQAAGLQRAIAQRQHELETAQKSIHPDPALLRQAEREISRLQCCLKPRVVIGRISPKDVVQAAKDSFDGGVTAGTIGTDLGESFLTLKARERVDVVGLLNESWQMLPLSGCSGATPGQLAILIQTRRRLPDILKGLNAGLLTPPVLFFEDCADVGGEVPHLSAENVWNQAIAHLLDTRYKRSVINYQVAEPAQFAFREFSREIASGLCHLPEQIRPYVAWLGELAPRIAVVLEAFDPKPGCEIDEHIARRAINITRWLGTVHTRAVSAASQPSADSADRAAAVLAKIRLKAPISYRELWRSFDQPRAEWFRPALQNLLDGGKVIYDEERRFVPAPSAIVGSAGSAD